LPEEKRSERDHIFISYAWEDVALAEWMALKLTAEGYAVWIDRFKLLGGETYPQDIDFAIKYRTFRLIALLSRSSVSKPNPVKERTLALNLARERNENFLIPLNVDGMRPTELDWMTNDLTFVPFSESWAKGYAQVLKKLSSLGAPRPVQNGREIAASVFLPTDVVVPEAEIIRTNLFSVERIPPLIRCYNLARPLERAEGRYLAENWAFRKADATRLLAFQSPPVSLPDPSLLSDSDPVPWADAERILGIRSTDVVSELLKKSLERKCIQRGLVWGEGKWILYFPEGLLPKGQIVFNGYKPKAARVQVTGIRKFYPDRFRYHLSPVFTVRRGITAEFVVQLKVRAYLTDLEGKPLRSDLIGPRRKKLARSWWNHEWLLRHLAMGVYLADDQPCITIGEGEEMIAVSARPLEYQVPMRIDEKVLIRRPTPEPNKDIEHAA
jgi:hypothetical protein